jgi:hypothetical protein
VSRSLTASPLVLIIVGALAVTWLDSNANPIAHGICSLATSNIFERLSCEYDAPATSPGRAPAPAPVAEPTACPCTHARYVGGDVLEPRSYAWTWALDGREHSLDEKLVGSEDGVVAVLQKWVASARDPRQGELAKTMLRDWGINPARLQEAGR